MNISDYKDEELIAELHERFRKPTIEEMIEERVQKARREEREEEQ